MISHISNKLVAALPVVFAIVVVAFLVQSRLVKHEEVIAPAPVPKPLKVLLVVGHDDEMWGAKYGDLREVDLNRSLANKIYNLLKKDPASFDVSVTQSFSGYHPHFQQFLTDHEVRIRDFRKERLENYSKEITPHEESPELVFNKAPDRVAQILYGVNLYATEINADLVLHVHFNDYPGRPYGRAGQYAGFAVYTPAPNLKNSRTSRTFADSLFDNLKQVSSPSNLPVENNGLMETDDLIAVGARNSLHIPSVLVEYGYIAEPRFNSVNREEELNKLAEATFQSLKNLSY
jgi:N-acetylmuramoyl-L-alanine amidase